MDRSKVDANWYRLTYSLAATRLNQAAASWAMASYLLDGAREEAARAVNTPGVWKYLAEYTKPVDGRRSLAEAARISRGLAVQALTQVKDDDTGAPRTSDEGRAPRRVPRFVDIREREAVRRARLERFLDQQVIDLSLGLVCGVLQIRNHCEGGLPDPLTVRLADDPKWASRKELLSEVTTAEPDLPRLVHHLVARSRAADLSYRAEYNLACYFAREAGNLRFLARHQEARARQIGDWRALAEAGADLAVRRDPDLTWNQAIEIMLTDRALTEDDLTREQRSTLDFGLQALLMAARIAGADVGREDREKVLSGEVRLMFTGSVSEKDLLDAQRLLHAAQRPGPVTSGPAVHIISGSIEIVSRGVASVLELSAKAVAEVALGHLRNAFRSAPPLAFETLRAQAQTDPALVDLAVLKTEQFARTIGLATAVVAQRLDISASGHAPQASVDPEDEAPEGVTGEGGADPILVQYVEQPMASRVGAYLRNLWEGTDTPYVLRQHALRDHLPPGDPEVVEVTRRLLMLPSRSIPHPPAGEIASS